MTANERAIAARVYLMLFEHTPATDAVMIALSDLDRLIGAPGTRGRDEAFAIGRKMIPASLTGKAA